jgi:hypothetical protein
MYFRTRTTLGQMPTQPIQPRPTAPMPTQPQFRTRLTWLRLEADLRGLLELRLRPDDTARIADRRSRLIQLFESLRSTPWDAEELYVRLIIRRPTDQLARLFHYRLATPTRRALLRILSRIVRDASERT